MPATGQSRLRGEAGVGKSALLEYLVGSAAGCQILRAAGVESEMDLAFAGLHPLCAPMIGHLDRLPGPQQDALAVAFGLSSGSAPDRFLVGLAVLSMLAEWRRSSRSSAWSTTLGGSIGSPRRRWPSSRVDCLGSGWRWCSRPVHHPLVPVAELAGGFGRPDARPLASQIEQSFVRRIGTLPTATQRLLLAAAAEPVGDVYLLRRAAELLHIGTDAAAAAEAAG